MLTYLRRSLLGLRKSLFYEREILVKISRNDCEWVPEKASVHYRDIFDHLSNFLEMTESHRDNVTSLMELYASMLNNQMARDSNQTNATVRRLTLITTIFMPLTLLAGIFGMSEWTVMTGGEANISPLLPYLCSHNGCDRAGQFPVYQVARAQGLEEISLKTPVLFTSCPVQLSVKCHVLKLIS